MNSGKDTGSKKVGFVSLGCPKALVDSERILTQLKLEGYDIVSSYEGADVVVVNTCGFIDSAVAESLDAIGEALAKALGDKKPALTIHEVPLDWCFQPGVKLDFRHFADGYVVSAADVDTHDAPLHAALDAIEAALAAGAVAGVFALRNPAIRLQVDTAILRLPLIGLVQLMRAEVTRPS